MSFIIRKAFFQRHGPCVNLYIMVSRPNEIRCLAILSLMTLFGVATDAAAVADTSWPNGSVDRFILAKLEENNLKPAAIATRFLWFHEMHFRPVDPSARKPKRSATPCLWRADDSIRECMVKVSPPMYRRTRFPTNRFTFPNRGHSTEPAVGASTSKSAAISTRRS